MAQADPPPTPGGGGGQVPSDRVAALSAYLEANRGRYTDDALRRAASSAGYTDAEIDAAALAVAAAGDGSAEPVRGHGANAKAIFIVIGYFVGVFVVASILSFIAETSLLALPAMGLGLVLAVLASVMLRDTRPALADAFKIGVIIVIVLPLVLGLVALGVCVVALGFAR